MTRPLVPESGYSDAVAILVTLLGLPEADWDVERRGAEWRFAERVSGATFRLNISTEWDHDERAVDRRPFLSSVEITRIDGARVSRAESDAIIAAYGKDALHDLVRAASESA